MTTPPLQADVAIIGGGPAGATAAKLLAGWGRSVVVFTRPASRSAQLGESLPPSTRKLLQHVGSLAAVDRAGFRPTRGNTVWWESDDARIERFSDGQTGYQVTKRDLERVLLALAEESGATVCRDTVMRGVDELTEGASRSVYGTAGARNVTTSARWVLDASGRAGVVARQGWRRSLPGTRTLALIATWTAAADWGVDDESHTLVESYAGGWAWSVPADHRTRYVTVMVDPRHTDVASRAAIGALYDAELAQTVHLKALLSRATLDGPPWACDASPYTADPVGAPGVLLVGDAASFIDPLSSFGVKKALASAWLAAVVTNTALAYPERTEAALGLFAERERLMFETSRRASAEHARAASASRAHPFWTDRATDVDLETPTGASFDVRQLRDDPDVRRAFEDLKRRPSIDLAPAPALRIEPRPVVTGRYVELQDHLVMGSAEPIRFLRDVNLAALVGLAVQHDEVPALFDAYNRSHPPVPLPDFLGALSVLIAKEGLVHRSRV